jgi:ATP-dependent protease HslVU (ClpYQ) peptidase subunit
VTCIVGLAREGKVWLGGDAAASSSWETTPLADPKVFAIGDEILAGVTGTLRTLQLLCYGFPAPPRQDGDDDMGYVVERLAGAMRERFKAAGYAKVENNVEGHEGAILVGYRGGLYTVHSGYGVERTAYPFAAVGSGSHHANAVLWASVTGVPERTWDPEAIVRLALGAAAALTPWVREPFTVLSLEAR